MTVVETVRGPIATGDLGATLMHEHVFVLTPEIEKPLTEWDEAIHIAEAIRRLEELKDGGIDTIVDLTVIGLGRDIRLIQRVAEFTRVNIVVATGLYTYNDVPRYFGFRGPGTVGGGPDVMTELFIRDIEKGVADTGV